MRASRKDHSLVSSQVASRASHDARLLLVGIVAGTGGMSAVQELLAGLDDHSSMAIVLLMDITHQSLMGDFLSIHCQWPIVEVSEPLAPQPGCLYWPALGSGLEMVEGKLRPVAHEPNQLHETSLDHFFVSLARSEQVDKVGVVLAGDGTAGAHGLRMINAAGGITFAQDPQTTKRAEMPRAAASLGLADRLLSPAAIATELVAHQRFRSQPQELAESASFEQDWKRTASSLYDQLARQTDYDFRNGDATWMRGRVSRRLLLHKLETLDAYLTQLASHPTECHVLARELTMQKKFLFCDSDLLRIVGERVFPRMIRSSNMREPLRCWVPACGTGEEAYCLAMLACEHLERTNLPLDLKVFATERFTNSIAIARTGIYPNDAEPWIPADRLQRFFTQQASLCCVNSAIRERVLFTVHDVLLDPPFAKLNMIVCRNLLRYFSADLQHQVLERFHFALRSGGFLLLGPDDKHPRLNSLFSCVDETHSVWQFRDVSGLRRRWQQQPQQGQASPTRKPVESQTARHDGLEVALQNKLLSEFTPQAVLVDSQGKVICTSATSNDFMKIQEGIFENNIHSLIIPSLRLCLRSALAEVGVSRRKVVHDNLVVPKGSGYHHVRLTVQPFEHDCFQDDLVLCVFEVIDEIVHKKSADGLSTEADPAQRETLQLVNSLEQQLITVRKELLQSLQEMEATNEELTASNEELLSINEELQATNEELETSKEELTFHRDSLAQAHNDQANLLRCSQVATIFLDLDFNIRDFSPSCAEYFSIVATDRGRSLNDLKPRMKEMPALPDPAKLFSEPSIEETFTGEFGKAYSRRILPYLSAEGEVNGVVINFVEITNLKASQEILALSLRAANMFAFAMNLETGSLCRQGGVCETLGLPEEDLFETYLQRIHVDDRPSLQEALSAVTLDSPYYHLTYRLKLPSGPDVWLREDAKVFFGNDGRPQRCVGSCREVTAEKKHELRLLESELRLASALDAASDGSWDWNIETGEVQYSDHWLHNLGYHTQEVAANIRFWESIVHPDDLEHTQCELQRHLRGETDVCYCENRLRTKSGEYRWNLIRGRVIQRTSAGEAMRMVATDTDITQRKQTELSLRLNEERLRLAAEAAGFGAFHFDLNAQRASCSASFRQLLGVHAADPEILEPFDLLKYAHPDDRGYFREHLSAISVGEIEWSSGFDFRVSTEEGATRWLRLQHKTLFQGDRDERRPTQIIGTLLDITGQRNFEEKLEAARQAAEVANASKSAFLANMSHEIRTPMTAVLGYAQLVAEKIKDPVAQGYLTTIQRNGEFLLEIINDILDLSKIEAGKLEVNPERFSPGRLVSDVRSVMEVRAKEKNLNLQVEYVGQIPAFITSDSKRLKQILINLVGNAIKFTQQGEVRVIVRHLNVGKSKLAFEVVDTGIGMTAAQQQRLFQPFSQGDASISRAFGGTGLGLVISQRLARMLGGKITVESSPERGSRFIVTIATGDVQSEQLVGPVVTESPAAPLMPNGTIRPGCRVLVVDDRRDIRLLAEKLLQKLGVTTEAAEDGLQAVAKVSEALTRGQVFHLVLLDMQMPRLDGYQTAEALRERGYANPILALTADAMQGDMNRCIACGYNDYLSKPIDAKLLAQKVYQLTKTLED